MLWIWLIASGGVDLSPVIIAVLGTGGISGLAAVLTYRSTNKRLRAETRTQRADAIKLYEEAISSAQLRNSQLEARVDEIRARLELRLEKAEAELAAAIEAREKVTAEGRLERERLNRRIVELEAQVQDLRRQLPGKRHRDPPRGR
jgi:chromosome segregation ATPase